MGNLFGKKKPEKRLPPEDGKEMQNKFEITNREQQDKQIIEELKKELDRNLEMFVLNHLLMSVMFYKSYEEIQEIHRKKHNDRDSNPILLKDFQTSCIKVDNISELVNNYIKFKYRHGPKKDKIEPLLHRRMYILHHNIEATTEDDNPYSGIDKPILKAKLHEIGSKGYTKLMYINEYDQNSDASSSGSDENINISKAQSDSNLSVYGKINDARTLKPLDFHESDTDINNESNFICVVKEKNLGAKNENEVYIHRKYLNSHEFMTYFREKSFRVNLAKLLGFAEEDLKQALRNEFSLYCNTNENNNEVAWEIIPAVLISWPVNQLYEYCNRRDRPQQYKSVQKIPILPIWPPKNALEENFDCVVIPRGFMSKYNDNKNSHLEWEFGFPQFERFLESKLSNSHIRSFLFLCVLHKTFIEPLTNTQGVTIDHLRNHIFWQVERHSYSWSEKKLGTRLCKVIQRLYDLLSQKRLPYYFIREKDLFKNIPGPILRKAQKQLHNIIQFPLMHFMVAFKNLEYRDTENFYPKPDLDKLHQLLIKCQIHPSAQKINIQERQRDRSQDPKLDPEANWHILRNKEKKRQLEEKKQLEEGDKNLKEISGSTETIDLMIKCDSLDISIQNRHEILVFFIEHFLKIIKHCFENNAIEQANLYITQANYLTTILNEQSAIPTTEYENEINEYFKKIHKNKRWSNQPPKTPSRNSILSRRYSTLVDEQQPHTIAGLKVDEESYS